MDDIALLHRYVDEGSDEALAELVQRHVNLVYGAALRQTYGNSALACDVTQTVFSDLARKASSLTRRTGIVGWLYTSTRFAATKARRTEARRQAREQIAYAMQEMTSTGDEGPEWERVRPVIDVALRALDESDREAVLLRFFEGCDFDEIGAALRVSGEAARKRVDRGLERMATALSRQGVTSTAAALALTLATQSAVAAPVGLAAQVATSIAASSGATAGVGGQSLLHFMSTAKLTHGIVAALILLGASLAGNAFLLSRLKPSAGTTPSRPVASQVGPAAPVGLVGLADLTQDDLTTMRDRLRTEGASEGSIRAILEGILRERYREKLSAVHQERYRDRWWLAANVRLQPTPPDDAKLLAEMVLGPLEKLLGRDPAELAVVNARYAYLPPELRQTLADLDEKLAGLLPLRAQANRSGTTGELERQRQSIEAERTQLVETLKPEERAEYDLRHAVFAPSLMRRMDLVNGTESEYRAVFSVADSYAQATQVRSSDENAYAFRHALDQKTAQQLVSTLGFDRAVDYLWSGVWEYPAYAHAALDSGLPASTASQVLQLAAETADQAAVIHSDPSITVEQKRAALAALQEKVRPGLTALMPLAAQQRLEPQALAWFSGLSEGRYKFIMTSLNGSPGGIINQPTSITSTPDANSPQQQLLPVRPSSR